jgi:hypothetical protein
MFTALGRHILPSLHIRNDEAAQERVSPIDIAIAQPAEVVIEPGRNNRDSGLGGDYRDEKGFR